MKTQADRRPRVYLALAAAGGAERGPLIAKLEELGLDWEPKRPPGQRTGSPPPDLEQLLSSCDLFLGFARLGGTASPWTRAEFDAAFRAQLPVLVVRPSDYDGPIPLYATRGSRWPRVVRGVDEAAFSLRQLLREGRDAPGRAQAGPG